MAHIAGVFAQARRLRGVERSRYLDQACAGDEALRQEVASLLAEIDTPSPVDTHAVANAVHGAAAAAATSLAPNDSSSRPPRVVPGSVLSHYRIVERLGAGGMGEVFRAEDLALGRAAALKVLGDAVSEGARARLLHEAKQSARLQHPAIATFFEAGEDGGIFFLAMEYVEGETLGQRLGRGPIPPAEALPIAAALLEALGHAHAVGLLHRDIKPANIMRTKDGGVKLLDFGLAKKIHEATPLPETSEDIPTWASGLTLRGHVVGTPGYMSPEQLRGEPLDTSSDLFAVGAVLYEMVAGTPAFGGAGVAERMAATLAPGPEPPRGPGISAGLCQVIERALLRDKTERYATTAEFLRDLQRVGEGKTVARLPDTIAVLDLKALSRGEDDGWIASGIAETVANDLARVPGLTVVAREKVVRATSGGETEAVEIGRRLGCRWVLGGSFQHLGPALRITAWLWDVGTGSVVTTEKLDGRLDDIFGMQDRLAAAVTTALDLQVAAPSPEPDEVLEAYEYTARGRRLWLGGTKGGVVAAEEMYRLAIAVDSGYLPALAGLALTSCTSFTKSGRREDLEEGARLGRLGLARDPENAECHVWLGYALWRLEGPEPGLEHEKVAIRLDPANPMAHYFATSCLAELHRYEEAVPLGQLAMTLAPKLTWAAVVVGWIFTQLERFTEALWLLERATGLELEGGPFFSARSMLAECLRRQGELTAARTQALAALAEVERTDATQRDTWRVQALIVLGRVAIQQDDRAAAVVAFGQAVAHIEGRTVEIAGGHYLVQALSGMAQAGADAAHFERAFLLFERHQRPLFRWAAIGSDEITLFELARAARALGRTELWPELLRQAIAAGSVEARSEADTWR